MAGVEPVGGRVFDEILEQPGEDRRRRCRSPRSSRRICRASTPAQTPRGHHHEADHEHRQQPAEQLDRHDLLVDQVLRLLLQLLGLLAGLFDPLLDLQPAAELGDQVAGRVESFGRPSFSPPVIADSICERIFVLARAVDFQLVLGRREHLLGRFDRPGLRRELLDEVGRDSRRNLAGAGPFVG